MRCQLRLVWFVVELSIVGAGAASATPVTWEASGNVRITADSLGWLAAISNGTPWTLDVTFDADAEGVHSCSTPTFHYLGAISQTRFQLGAYTYANAGGEIHTNADLPYVGCSTPLGGPGLVQFVWSRGWTGGAGGPDLNMGLGLMLASYNDVNAVDGSLPRLPHPGGQGSLSGLEYDGWSIGADNKEQFVSSFSPQAVPEPASCALLGAGLAGLAARRRRRQSSSVTT